MWQRRRSSLNHDWLRSRVALVISRALRVISGEVIAADFDLNSAGGIVGAWRERRDECVGLLEDCAREMTPAVLLNETPLDQLDGDSREWLGEVIHELWLVRYAIDDRVASALALVSAVDQTCEALRVGLLDDRMQSRVQLCDFARPLLGRLRTEVVQLSEAIEELPKDIRIA